MILVEIATRCDLISVSMAALSIDYNLRFLFDLCLVTSSLFQQDQTEGARIDIMWRPPLPELKAGKTDTDCPSQGDYCEVCNVCKVGFKHPMCISTLRNNKFSLEQLIRKCWSHNITMRPTFEQVKKMLEKMNPHKVSPVDMMMNLVTSQ